ncbi:MAG: DUF2157 domain-containing protein [Dehalococcoidia bacterium]
MDLLRTSSVEEQLNRWHNAGLIDEEQARRILAFEQRRSDGGRGVDAERPSILEAMLYLGIAVAVVGVITLIAQNWEDLRTWARIAVLAVPGTLLLLAGLAMRTAVQPAVQRASGVAWLAAVALIAGAAAVAGYEGGWDDRQVLLLAGTTATGLALGLWAVQPAQPQMVAVAGSFVVLAVAAAQWVEGYEAETAGLLIAAFGAVLLAATESGRFGPTTVARLLSAAGIMAGLIIAAYLAGNRLWIELLVFGAGVALIALGLRRADFGVIVVAVGGLFLGLILFIFRHFEDNLGAPLALLLTGALVIAGVLLLALLRGRVKAEAVS